MRGSAQTYLPRFLALAFLVALPCLWAWGQPPQAKPDLIVGDIGTDDTGASEFHVWGRIGDITAYSVATTSCNKGQVALNWLRSPNPNHPVIAQNLYRIAPTGRIEQLGGLSWLKHGFSVRAGSICGDCEEPGTTVRLGRNCSDLYVAWLNGSFSNLGPRSEVNAATGAYSKMPFSMLPSRKDIDGRVQARRSELDPALNRDARYLIEAEYVHPEDARAGMGANNASTREVFVTTQAGEPTLTFRDDVRVRREDTALEFWSRSGPGVVKRTTFDVPGDGRMLVGVRTIKRPEGSFHHEIALQNINSDRSVGALTLTTAGGAVSNPGFHAPTYQFEKYDPSDWSPKIAGSKITWSTQKVTENENANAVRWGTLYSYWFDSEQPVTTVELGLFKEGLPATLPPARIQSPPSDLVAERERVREGVPEGRWLLAPRHLQLDLGPDGTTFHVYAPAGSPEKLARVVTESADVTVRQSSSTEGDKTVYAIHVAPARGAPRGHFEALLKLEPAGKGRPVYPIDVFGVIGGE